MASSGFLNLKIGAEQLEENKLKLNGMKLKYKVTRINLTP